MGAPLSRFHGWGWDELPQSKPDGFASSPEGGSFSHGGKVSGSSAKFPVSPEAPPFEERLPPLRGKMSCSDKRGNLSPQVTERSSPLPENAAAAVPHPHPALRATFPRLGEGFSGDGKVSGPRHPRSPFGELPPQRLRGYQWRTEKKVQRRRPPPAADAGRSCWGSGQQDTSAAQGTKWTLGTATRLSEAARFFPVRLPLWGLKGASSPFLVDPARRNRWLFSGSLLQPKENKPRRRCILQKASSLPHAKPLCTGSRNPPAERPARLRRAETSPAAPLRRRTI